MAGINHPVAYSKILDKGFTLQSLTAPAFKGEYKVVGGTTSTFKIYSTDSQALSDYSARKRPTGAQGVGNFGFQYQSVNNSEQTVTATQDKYFAGAIDKVDAKFSKDGSLDASEFMRVQMEEVIYPTLDKYNIKALVDGAATANVKQELEADLTKANAYTFFLDLTGNQTNKKVPRKGRVAFVSVDFFKLIKLDPNFTPASELTAHARRSGNYGMVDGVLVIEAPNDYLGTGIHVALTHEKAAAAPKHLADYNQGEFKESASGYYVNGRIVYDAFILNKKKDAIQILKTKAA